MYRFFIKRLIDFLAASIVFLCLLPVFIAVSIAILITSGTPLLFRQKRPGYHGKVFEIIKFRTMLNTKDSNGNNLPDNIRITSVGSFLRRTSLDEIPQLLNVIKGDMSIIGPRPLLLEYLPYYTYKELQRHNVKPGLTGLAQVNGRNNLPWDMRLNYDLQYVNNVCFIQDIKIVLMTLKNVFLTKDINVIPGEKMKNFDEERRTRYNEIF